ncbi:MAG: hypothetical protein DCC52_04695 [Chloroflexi bacterium]|nr:MAG: hypothetical protein DCC52_04695 [Chloroflexota bacterium]
MTNQDRRPDEARLDQTLRRLQYILPLGIVAAVSVYAFVSMFFLQTRLDAWARLGIEILIFGGLGAGIAWFALRRVRQDLAAQRERDRAARVQEHILAAITANSGDAIILLDNDNKIQSWNRGAELLFGYHAAEIVGKDFETFVPPDLQDELSYLDRQLQEQGVVRGWITRRLTRDGNQPTVDLTRTLLRDDQGQVIGSSAILRDITEREANARRVRELNRQLETQVAQRTRELAESNKELRKRQRELEDANAELQELDTLKSEFVSLVSHELRAPLTNVSGSLELLLADTDSLTAHQRELLTLANDQLARLARLVRGILNVSRIEAGQTLLQMQAFDITALVERMCSQWQFCDPDHTYRAFACAPKRAKMKCGLRSTTTAKALTPKTCSASLINSIAPNAATRAKRMGMVWVCISRLNWWKRWADDSGRKANKAPRPLFTLPCRSRVTPLSQVQAARRIRVKFF